MKSIYNKNDLSFNEIGHEIDLKGREFFLSILDKYPQYSPREICQLLSAEFHVQSSCRILKLRATGKLKKK